MQSTRRPDDTHDDPAELDARALDLEAEAATLRARAIRLRRAKPTVQATPAPTAETLLTTPQMAKRLGVSPSRVTHLLEPGAPIGVEMLAWVADVLGRRWVVTLEPEGER